MATTTLGALARIARRDAILHRRHSLLLMAMIALPVAGLVAGTTLLDSLWQRPGSDWIRMWGSLIVVVFWTLYALTLVAAVLMASAAVTIATRRQLRVLGLLAAAGRGRQLGTVVILQAAALGLGAHWPASPPGCCWPGRCCPAWHEPSASPSPSRCRRCWSSRVVCRWPLAWGCWPPWPRP